MLKFKELKIIFNKSNNILNETEILPLAPFRAAVKAIIFCNRLSSTLPKMPAVDIKLGTSLIVTYDGCPDNFNTFLDAVSQDTVNTEFAAATADQRAAANETLFKFIKTRLTGTARLAITGAVTIEEILQNLKRKCSSKVNSDGIRAKLKATKQKGSVTEFCDAVEHLTSRLANLYIYLFIYLFVSSNRVDYLQ